MYRPILACVGWHIPKLFNTFEFFASQMAIWHHDIEIWIKYLANTVLLFYPPPTVFSMLSNTGIVILSTLNLSSTNAFNLFKAKILTPGKELNLSQATDFRLFETERVCRWQVQSWKLQKVLQKGRKLCGKRRNCSLWAISLFPTVFSEDFYCRHIKTRACLGNG